MFTEFQAQVGLHDGLRLPLFSVSIPGQEPEFSTSAESCNRWFTEFWGENFNLGIIDEIAAPDILLRYSLHEPRRGRDDIKAFMTNFRAAFPDLNYWGTADLIAEGDYILGQWEGGAQQR